MILLTLNSKHACSSNCVHSTSARHLWSPTWLMCDKHSCKLSSLQKVLRMWFLCSGTDDGLICPKRDGLHSTELLQMSLNSGERSRVDICWFDNAWQEKETTSCAVNMKGIEVTKIKVWHKEQSIDNYTVKYTQLLNTELCSASVQSD